MSNYDLLGEAMSFFADTIDNYEYLDVFGDAMASYNNLMGMYDYLDLFGDAMAIFTDNFDPRATAGQMVDIHLTYEVSDTKSEWKATGDLDARLPAVEGVRMSDQTERLDALYGDDLRIRQIEIDHPALAGLISSYDYYGDEIPDYFVAGSGSSGSGYSSGGGSFNSPMKALNIKYYNDFLVNNNNPAEINCGVYAYREMKPNKDKVFENLINPDLSILVDDYCKRVAEMGDAVKLYDGFKNLLREYEPNPNPAYKINKPSGKTLSLCVIDEHAYLITSSFKNKNRYRHLTIEELIASYRDDDRINLEISKKSRSSRTTTEKRQTEKLYLTADEFKAKYDMIEKMIIDEKEDAPIYRIYTDGTICELFYKLARKGIIGDTFAMTANSDICTMNTIKYKNDKIDISIRHIEGMAISKQLATINPEDFNIFKYLCDKLNNFSTGHLTRKFTETYFKPLSHTHLKFRDMTENAVKYDRCNSHISSLYKPYKFGYSLYLGVEEAEPVYIKSINDIKQGLYYVETAQVFPLKNSGWYSDDMIYYCLEQEYITPAEITHYLKPSRTLPIDYFRSMIDGVLKDFPNKADYKKMFVIFCGNLARTRRATGITIFSKSEYDFKYYSQFRDIMTIKPSNTMPYYQFTKRIEEEITQNFISIFSKIRENEIIALDALSNYIGGEIAYIQADAITINNPQRSLPDSMTDIMGGFKPEVIKRYQIEQPVSRYRLDTLMQEPPIPFSGKTRNIPVVEDFGVDVVDSDKKYYQIAEDEIISGKSIMINSKAGHGKSFLWKSVRAKLIANGKKVYTMSFTNSICCEIEGKTINSSFRIPVGNEPICQGLVEELKNADVVATDEAFLIPAGFLQFYRYLKQGKKQLIFMGDENQLIAISKSWKPLQMAHFNSLVDMRINLMISFRYSESQEKIIENMIATGIFDMLKRNIDTDRAICFYNQTRKRFNHIKAEKFITANPTAKTHKIDIDDAKDRYAQPIIIAEGMPVMAYTTSKAQNIYNGTLGSINKINDDTIHIKTKKEILIVHKDIFANYFVVAFAMTLYKCQGHTFDFPYSILDMNTIKRIQGGIYTALTRTENIDDVSIAESK